MLAGAGILHRGVVRPESTPSSEVRMATLINAPVPERNLYTLTEQLKLNGHTAIPHVVNLKAPNYPVGHTDRFWILNQITDRYFTADATIVCETPHLYLYVERGVTVSRQQACESAEVFEHHIYPTDRRTFGSEWTPGVDDDPHITVFYGDIKYGGGYYAAEDEYPRIVDPFSNQREIVFISSTQISLGRSFDETLAHEFQHMIHWHMHPRDEAWLNEGASMLAQEINGYSADGLDEQYAQTPDVQLDAWSDDGPDLGAHYGAGFLWMDYLYERFGRSFIHQMLTDRRYSGFPLVADVLRRRHIRLSVAQVFADWAVANYVNDHHDLGSRYGYINTGIHVSPLTTLPAAPSKYQSAIHPYAPVYVTLNPGHSPTNVVFHGVPTIPLIGTAQPGSFWWSNRCDNCDTSMTRSLDLRHTRNPILSFATWYDIEKDYDYGYVEVSDNGGSTWQTLRSSITTRANPNGDSFGNGITGRSSHTHGSRDGWVPVRMSLRRYAGRTILLRFEYVTDDEYNGQSWAVRDIAVSAAGYHDRIGDRSWSLQGFVPIIRNVLSNHWSLQLITSKGNRQRVRVIPVSPSGDAELTLPPSAGGSRPVLAIFSRAAKTTLTSEFRLTAASVGGHAGS